MADDTYTSKEMIEIFRQDNEKHFDKVDKRFDGIDARLDSINTTQGLANTKTRRHGFYFSALWWALGVMAFIFVSYGKVIYHFVVTDIAVKSAAISLSSLEVKYNLKIND